MNTKENVYTNKIEKKSSKPLIDRSKIFGGIILSIIGGLSSILLGFLIPDILPGVTSLMGEFVIILQEITIAGGIITLIGVIIVISNPKTGGIIILIGGLVAGLNFLTIIGAASIFKKINRERFGTSGNRSRRFPPVSELQQEIYSLKLITEVSQLKDEELQSVPSISDKKEEKLRVTSYTCKSCGNELIKKGSFCPYCGK